MSETNYDNIMAMHADMRTLNPFKIHNIQITTETNGIIIAEVIGEDVQKQKRISQSMRLTRENAIHLKNCLDTLFAERNPEQ